MSGRECFEMTEVPRRPVSAARRDRTRGRRAIVRSAPMRGTVPWREGRAGAVVLGVALLGVVVDVLLLPLRRLAPLADALLLVPGVITQ